MRNSKPRWPEKWTPPSWKSSLRQTQLTQSSYCPGASPLQFLFHYMNEVLATTVQWEEDIPMTTPVPELEGSRSQTPQTVQLITLGLHILHCLHCWISPSLALPWLDAHLWDSLLAPHRKSRTIPPAAYSVFSTTSRPVLTPKRSRLGANIVLYRVRRTHPHWHWRLGPALNHKGRNLSVTLPVQPRPLLILMMVQWWEHQGVLGIRTVRAVPRWIWRECGQLWHGVSLWGFSHLLRHRQGDHQNFPQEVQEEGTNFL